MVNHLLLEEQEELEVEEQVQVVLQVMQQQVLLILEGVELAVTELHFLEEQN